jgi:hypothetical protein
MLDRWLEFGESAKDELNKAIEETECDYYRRELVHLRRELESLMLRYREEETP